MFKKIKLGLTLVKYGFRPGTNLVMCILFLAIGVVLEISSKGTNIIGAFYFLLTGVYIYHMIESMSISKMVQTSKMKKALQTTVPTATSTLLYLVIFTCVVIEKAILIHNYPENTQIYLETLLIIVAYQVTAMLYIGLCYKYFVAATICFFAVIMGLTAGAHILSRNNHLSLSFPVEVIIGYIAIIVAAVLEYLISTLIYKKELSKFVFKGVFGKLK